MPLMRRGVGRRGPGLVGTVARTAVVAGTATAVVGGVSAHQQNKQAAQQQAAAEQAAPPLPPAPVDAAPVDAAPAPAPAGGDRMAQLQQLGDLHTQGILTDDEFAAEKAKILAS
jgi:hypothetical protein